MAHGGNIHLLPESTAHAVVTTNGSRELQLMSLHKLTTSRKHNLLPES